MEFRLLGLLEVVTASGSVDLTAPKVRVLVAMLALHPNQVVSADRLMEALWGEQPPPSAASTLQTYVSKLRGLLGPELIQTRSPGYVLSVDPQQVDAGRFEALVANGVAALRGGDPQTASDRLGEALSLWRGEALADFTFETFAQPERARLEEARLGALEDWAEAELARGRHGDLVGRLRALAEEHPLRERLWGQLMVSLYRSGRQAEALRTYSELRRRLSEDLGIEPSVELQRLESAVLLQEPELAAPLPLPSRPSDQAGRVSAALRAMALPPRLDVSQAYAFVGRERETEQLELRRLSAAATTEPTLVLITGEPGVGKTRLAAELARHAHRDGAIVLYGKCDEELLTPYQPFAEAAAQIARQLSPEDLAAFMGTMGGEVIRLAPQLGDSASPATLAPAEPEVARQRMYETLARGVGHLSSCAPVVLVLDDLHWASRPTLGLLRYLLTCDEPMTLLVIATYRDTQAPLGDREAELLLDLEGLPGAARVNLKGLDEDAVRELIVHASGGQLGDRAAELASSIRADTGGNPLFVGQLVRHLVESATPVGPEVGRRAATLGHRADLPGGIVGVVRRRLARLSDTSVRVLRIAAVVGVEYDMAVVQVAADLDDDSVVGALDEGVEAGLVVEMPGSALRQRFAHGLVRSALYGDLSLARRALLHRQVGEAIERLFSARVADHLPDLAHHFGRAAGIGTRQKAIEYAVRAGERALGQLAYDEAVSHYEEALRRLEDGDEPDVDTRFAILLALTDARHRAGDSAGSKEAARAAADDARRLASAERLTRVALLYDHLGVVGQPDPTAVSLCQEALESLGPDQAALRAQLLAKVAYHRCVSEGQASAADAMSREALELARQVGDVETLEAALHVRALTLAGTAHVEQRRRLAEEMLALPGQATNMRLQARGTRIRAIARLELGDVTGFEEDVDRLEELGDAVRHWVYQCDAAQWRTLKALLDGRLDDVEPGVERMMAYAGTDMNFIGAAIGQRFFLRREQGRLPEACALIACLADAEPGLVVFRSMRAMAYAEMGQMDAARRALEALAGDGFSRVPRDLTWMGSMVALAEISFRLEDASHAEVLWSLLEPHRGHMALVAFSICIGAVDRYLGMLAAVRGDWAESQDRFDDALRLEQRVGSGPLCARTRTAHARTLLQRGWDGDHSQATALLDAARASAEELGMAGLVAEIDGLSMANSTSSAQPRLAARETVARGRRRLG